MTRWVLNSTNAAKAESCLSSPKACLALVNLDHSHHFCCNGSKMPPFEMFALMLAAAAAGAINAVAGGGTLITFPALLFFGMPPVIANATSTLALLIGTSGSIYGYRRHLRTVKPWLWRFALISIIGGLIGAVLLTFT